MNAVDPFAGEISERRKVLFRREPARLKAAHLARRSRCIRGRLSADYPPHRGIMAQALSVVHIFISGKPTEHRLSQHSNESMPAIPAGAGVGEHLARHRAGHHSTAALPMISLFNHNDPTRAPPGVPFKSGQTGGNLRSHR